MRIRVTGMALTTVAMASLVSSILSAPQAFAAESDRTIISLPRESQNVPKRSTLETIQRAAKKQKISLADAIDAYVAHAVNTNPSVTRRAREDGLDPTVVEPEMKIDDLWLSELVDAKVAAKGNNIPLEEAIERIAWQPRLNEIGAKIEARYPDDLSGLAVLEDGRKAQIGFKGDIPAYAIELAKTLPVAVDLIGNKGFSEKDLKEARETAYAQLKSQVNLVEGINGGYDTNTGVITFTVKPRADLADVTERQSISAQLQPTPPTNKNISIALRLTKDDLVTKMADTYMRGGGVIGGCTTGFNIINQNYPSDPDQRRMTTAQHCGDVSTLYKNHPVHGNTGTLSDYVAGSSTYDIASWNRGTFTLTRTFYFNLDQTRYVYYIGTNPAVGQNICNFGWASHVAQCGNISQVNNNQYPNERGLIVMDRAISIQGDSGGPWYKGNTAWGITMGTVGGKSAFTPAYLIPSALGASWQVWTAPPGT
ncbi:hypothetical protein [Nonomuraea sp. NPDC049758]|uniref:hypothetical protein n=1 Tax=Nonomuraea sp. NPDC049758 TaxID=3154360 RepID=UPI00344AEBA6